MLKLLLCIFCAVATAFMALQLRQQHLNLAFQTNKLHNQIEASQSQLWNQQMSIAVCTAPNAIAANLKSQNIKLTTLKPQIAPTKHTWAEDPDTAE